MIQQSPGTATDGVDLCLPEIRTQLGIKILIWLEPWDDAFNRGEQVGRNGRANKIPDHGAQLVIGMKADAMIDHPELAGWVHQEVATLAIRVVHQQIEKHHGF